MNHDQSRHSSEPQQRGFRWVLLGFIAIAAFLLITEHRAHLYGFLPYAFLLACPLMHLFMHGGHGGHQHHHHRHDNADPARSREKRS